MVTASARDHEDFIFTAQKYEHLSHQEIMLLVRGRGQASKEQREHLLACGYCRHHFDNLVMARRAGKL
jgi:hypothetical protein